MSSDLTFMPVKSSMLSGIHHDPASQVLTARFKGGGVYEYAGVPAGKISAMLAAPSVGAHFAANVRPHHPAKKVG